MAGGVPALHPERKGQLNRSPKVNWVEQAGGLPAYINSVATALERQGMPRSVAIQIAVRTVQKACATGLWGGQKRKVSPAIQAAACKAAGQWEAMKLAAKARSVTTSAPTNERRALELAQPTKGNTMTIDLAHRKIEEDDPRFNWRTMGNRRRGVKLKNGQTKVVSPDQFDRLKAQGKLSASNPKMLGDSAGIGASSGGKWDESKHPRQPGGAATGGRFRALSGAIDTQAAKKGQQIGPAGNAPTDPKTIRALQRKLGIKADGKYDARTKTGVTGFQKRYGLKVDGIAGRQTLTTLRALRTK